MLVYVCGMVDASSAKDRDDWITELQVSIDKVMQDPSTVVGNVHPQMLANMGGVILFKPHTSFFIIQGVSPIKFTMSDSQKMVTINETALAQCDAMVVRLVGRFSSWGVPQEVRLAHSLNKPTVFWASHEVEERDIRKSVCLSAFVDNLSLVFDVQSAADRLINFLYGFGRTMEITKQ